MKKVLVFAVAGFISSFGISAYSQTAGAFMKNPAFSGSQPTQCVSTFEMEMCAAHDLRLADAEMSRRYSEVRASLTPAAKEKLLTEQRIWLKARDRDCLAKARDGGSVASITVARCWITVTKDRSTSFDKILARNDKSMPAVNASAFLGRWRGGEGTVMKITRNGDEILIENQWGLDEDMRGKFIGVIENDGLQFKRNGVMETARLGAGSSVNVSALRGKKDCLVISRNEGYCRY